MARSRVNSGRYARENAPVGWFSRKVLVTLIDDSTGAAFATTKVPPADLPESFAIATTLEAAGLPSPGADVEEVYRVASKLSAFRESIHFPDDGVYCPICHIANGVTWEIADALS